MIQNLGEDEPETVTKQNRPAAEIFDNLWQLTENMPFCGLSDKKDANRSAMLNKLIADEACVALERRAIDDQEPNTPSLCSGA